MINTIVERIKKQLTKAALVCLLPIVSYYILCPLENFAGNIEDLEFAISDFFWAFLLAGIVCWLIGSLIVALLPQKISNILCTLIMAFGVMSYIQNMFMNTKMGEMDGSAIKISEMGSYVGINAIIWVIGFAIIVVLSFVIKEYWNYVCMGLPAFLSAIQLVAAISVLISFYSVNTGDMYALVGNNQYELGSENNVIVIILDGFGNVLLDQTREEYPNVLEGFEDFTYYNNADCAYYRTFPVFTHFLTGYDLYLDNDKNAFDWQEEAWSSERAESFFDKIHSAGYKFELYESDVNYVFGSAKNLYGKIDNAVAGEKEVKYRKLWFRLFKMSAYCYMPYIVKPHFTVTNDSFKGLVCTKSDIYPVTDNISFSDAINEKGFCISDTDENKIIIQSLLGSHYPLEFDENGNAVETEDETSYIKNASGCIRLVEHYFEALKELGLYDSSTIILMADHGQWAYKCNGKHYDVQPIFFIKKAGEKHDEMQVCSAPISLSDMQATWSELVGVKTDEFGKSIFDYLDGEKRTRSVYARDFDENFNNVNVNAIYNFRMNFNVYRKYTYDTDREELLKKIEAEDYETYPVMPWEN